MSRRDPVTPEVRRIVLQRDGMCILFRADPLHECRDQWGSPHSPYALDRLTLDHVKRHQMLGRRAPSDPAHLVAMCGAGNVGVPSKAARQVERIYLSTLYPEVWA